MLIKKIIWGDNCIKLYIFGELKKYNFGMYLENGAFLQIDHTLFLLDYI